MKNKPSTISRSGVKWLPGAMALAATTASSQAATVQITLLGNKISTTGGDQLNADLTGDGVDDVTVNHLYIGSSVASFVGNLNNAEFFAGKASYNAFSSNYRVRVGGFINSFGGTTPLDITGFVAAIFQDDRINNGEYTNGWLEIRAFNTGKTDHTVEFTRLIFNDADSNSFAKSSISGVQTEWSAVPEPSSFALLSLGAAGLLARRRRQAA
jgi:hypothetical protein